MTQLSPVQTADQEKGPRSRSFASKVAIFTAAAALAIAPALVAGTAANAAGPIVVTTPADGATNVPQSFPNVVDFAGSNLPVTDYVDIKYLDATGVVRQGTFSGGTNDGAGNWTVGANFAQLSQGQTEVTAVVSGLTNANGTPDPDVVPTTVTFELAIAPNPANPFTISQPVTNSTTPVEDTTPTFAGTGNPGATIEITYGARAGQTGVAAEVVVDEDGNWTTETDFSLLEPGETDGSAIVTEYGTDGAVFPGTTGQRINFVFPSAPAPLIPLTVTVEPTSVTQAEASTTGVAFLATGFSPGEGLTIAVTDQNGGVVELPQSDPFFADPDTGSFVGVVILPTTAGTGTYTITVTSQRSDPVRVASGTFAVVANPVTPVTPGTPGTLPVVSG